MSSLFRMFLPAPGTFRQAVRPLPMLLACAGLFTAFPATAWNAAGHRLSAAIAWSTLSPAARQEVDFLLAAHPAAAEWRAATRETWAGAQMAEAAVWPDSLRKSLSETAGADGSEHPDMHRDWHYLNWPLGETRRSANGGELDRQLARLPGRVADRSLAAAERSIALAWLIHLAGDAHMPLHTANWRDDNGNWTLGGNRVPVIDTGNPRRPETNLHRYWDDLPGPVWLRGKRLVEKASLLLSRYPAASVAQLNAERWIEESHQLAARVVRMRKDVPLTIDTAYHRHSTELAERRVTEAGVRLGRLLEDLLRR